MLTLESNGLFGQNVYCPKCGTLVHEVDGDESTLNKCDHLVFIATDVGFEIASKELIDAYENQEEDDAGEVPTIDEFTSKLDIVDGIKFAIYAPAPSFFGVYIGFDFK